MIITYLFDLDDTLIDSKIYQEIYNKILQKLKEKLNLNDLTLSKKLQSLKLDLNKYGRYDTGELCQKLDQLELYYEILEAQLKVKPLVQGQVKNVFISLHQKGKKIGIVSNSMRRTIELYLKKYNLKADIIFSSEDAGCKKREDTYWQTLIEKEKLNPEECLMIGDEYDEDILMAKKFGFKTFYLKEMGRLREVLEI